MLEVFTGLVECRMEQESQGDPWGALRQGGSQMLRLMEGNVS